MKSISDIKKVDKGWGHELWIANSNNYCGKLLFFNEGKRCSIHYHRIKDETFYLQSGKLVLNIWNVDDGLHVEKTMELLPGSSYHLPPGTIHQMVALEDSELFEFSTEHVDSDSYRIAKGDGYYGQKKNSCSRCWWFYRWPFS